MNKLYLILSLLMFIVTSCKENEVFYNTAAKADFTMDEDTYELGESVILNDASIPSQGTKIISWLWNFGDADKSTSTEQNPQFTYKIDGTYTIMLTVTDNNGLQAYAKKDVTILDPTKAINVLWRKDLSGTVKNGSSPALAADGSMLYMYGSVTKPDVAYLNAYDVTTGDIRWSLNIDEAMKNYHDGSSDKAGASDIFGSPSVGANGDIYFLVRDLKDAGAMRRLFMFAIKNTGVVNWAYSGKDNNMYSITPAIDASGNIYVGHRSNEIWKFVPTGGEPEKITASQNISSGMSLSKSGILYFGVFNKSFYGYDVATGTQSWQYGTDFAGTGLKSNTFTIDADGNIYSVVDLTTGGSVIALNSDGTRKWIYQMESTLADGGGVVLGIDGTIYANGGKAVAGMESAGIVALNPDGSLKWHFPTEENVSNVPVVDNRGYIHFISDKAIYYIVKPDGTLFSSSVLGVSSFSSPVMDEKGNLYAAIQVEGGIAQMFCITSGAKSYANSAWPMKGQNPQRTGLQK